MAQVHARLDEPNVKLGHKQRLVLVLLQRRIQLVRREPVLKPLRPLGSTSPQAWRASSENGTESVEFQLDAAGNLVPPPAGCSHSGSRRVSALPAETAPKKLRESYN